jgi:uroporphyrinogen-III decarboxylase
VISAATIDQMRLTDSWFPEAHTNPQMMACLAAASYEILGFDNVMPVFSVVPEAAALGCEVNWGTPHDLPSILSHPFESQTEFSFKGGWVKSPLIQVVL